MNQPVRLQNYRNQKTISKSSLAASLFCGATAITQLMDAGKMPEPLPTLSPNRPRWLLADIECWLGWDRPDGEEFARLKRVADAEMAEATIHAWQPVSS